MVLKPEACLCKNFLLYFDWTENRQTEVMNTTEHVGIALFVYVGYMALPVYPPLLYLHLMVLKA